MASTVRGGNKLRQFFRTVKQAKHLSVKGVDVGFFATARYPDVSTGKNGGKKQKPHHVATVAAWNEFGTRRNGKQHVPERPFMRQAIKAANDDLTEILIQGIDAKKMILDPITAGRMGLAMQNHIQRRITTLRDPPDAPSTIERKGSSNPLIDTGFMRQSVSFRVDS